LRGHLNRSGKMHGWPCLVVLSFSLLSSVSACTPHADKSPFDPRRCMAHIPRKVEGLTIVAGSRTKASIIRDMVPVVCNGQVLFNRKKIQDPQLKAGTVIFRVVVEYTGEVIAVNIAETAIQSDAFLRKVSDFIMDTDFVGWARDDIDTVFLYPVRFGS
jgi:hypothetical protein